MTGFTTISDVTAAQDKPATQSLIRALRDNPLAIAEDDATAPAVVGLNGNTTLTASSSGSLVFTGISSAYDIWEIEMINLVMSTDTTLGLQVSIDNGSNWRTGNEYRYSYSENGGNATGNPASRIQLSDTLTGTRTINGIIRLFQPAAANTNRMAQWAAAVNDSAGVGCVHGGGHWSSVTDPVDAVRLIPASGTIVSGKAVLKVRRG